jgi:DNA repair exonuclease SbcCD nuclease subunit
LNAINIIFFSDTHLGFDYPLRPRVNKRRRGEDFFNNFETVLSYAKTKQCDLVIHGGDLFFRSKLSQHIVDRVYQTLTNFVSSGIPICIVPGNHERSCLPISLFLIHPLIHVFNYPKIITLKVHGARINVGGFPFSKGDINKAFLSELKQSGWYDLDAHIKILALHQAIEGATVGPANYTFRNGEDVLTRYSLPDDAMLILCGHIHRQQILKKQIRGTSAYLPIIFSGSIERTSFAEMDEKKGFYHLTFDLIKSDKWYLKKSKFISLPTRPMQDIYIDEDLSISRSLSHIKKTIIQLDPNSIIRFKSHKPIRADLAKIFTINKLNQLIPASINFTFDSRFFQH